MHHCFACSSYDAPKRRRRKKTLMSYTKNQNKATAKPTPWINFQSIGDLAIVLDPTIVNKYFKAKRTIDEIMRPADHRESYLSGYPRVYVNNNDDPSVVFSTQTSPPAFSASNGLFIEPCIISIKEELSEERSIDPYNKTLLESRMVEIPIDSNIVLNPMNNQVTFSQLNNDEADSQPQATEPKYVYNPMNNIVTSSQTCDESDDNNNSDQPSDIPADVQFAPGEYVLGDDFLNSNYDVVNAFALEPVDVDSNQNTLTVSEHINKEQSLTMKMVDAVVNPDVVGDDDDDDLLENKEIDTSETLRNPVIKEQEESILHDEGDQKTNVETECEEFACGKCNKKFRLLYCLRKHELTCGMTFQYNCLYCTKSSMLSHTIKCHMSNRHVEQVAIYGMKELMEIVIKRRKKNKVFSETKLNAQQSEEILVLPDVGGNFVLIDNLKKYQRNNKRKQTFPKARRDVGIDKEDYTFQIKKEILDNDLEDESNMEVSYVSNNDVDLCINFKPSKEYIDALCSNCNVHLKNLKSGAIKCCPNCQSPLIYKCVVCRKCFSKYLSICGHVKYHPQSNLCQIANLDDKHYCGYCSYETVLKSQLLRHLLGHVREKSVKIKREYTG